MILLDTDHLSVLAFSTGPQGKNLTMRLREAVEEQFAITIVSAEEQMRGWLAELRRQHSIPKQVPVYERLAMLIDFWSGWDIVRFDMRASTKFEQLVKQRIRIGAQDLKIVAIALVHNALLLSANLQDFQQVPGLRVEDWLS